MKLIHSFLALIIALLPMTLNAAQDGKKKKIPYPSGEGHGETCTCLVCPGIKKHNGEVDTQGGRPTAPQPPTSGAPAPLPGKAAAPNHCRHNIELNLCLECTPRGASPEHGKPTVEPQVVIPVGPGAKIPAKPRVCPTCGVSRECPKCQKAPPDTRFPTDRGEARPVDPGKKCPHGVAVGTGACCYACSKGLDAPQKRSDATKKDAKNPDKPSPTDRVAPPVKPSR